MKGSDHNCYPIQRAAKQFLLAAIVLMPVLSQTAAGDADVGSSDLMDRCTKLVFVGKSKEALDLVDRAIAAHPKDAEPYLIKAQILRNLKKFDTELEVLNKLIALAPNCEPAYVMRARIYFFLGEARVSDEFEANYIRDMETALKLNPKSSEALDLKGVHVLAKKQYKEAIALFTKAISNNAGIANYYEHRATAYNSMGDRVSALKDLSQAVKVEPSSYGLWSALANQYESLGKPKEAKECFDHVVKMKPQGTNIRRNRAAFFVKWRYYKEAVDDLNKIIKVAPLDDDAFRLRGDACLGLGQYEQAVKDYTEAIELSPELAVNFKARAKAYRLMKKESLAREDEAWVIKLNRKSLE